MLLKWTPNYLSYLRRERAIATRGPSPHDKMVYQHQITLRYRATVRRYFYSSSSERVFIFSSTFRSIGKDPSRALVTKIMVPKHEENAIILERSPGTSCTVNLHGATVLSWKVDGKEQLFVSSSAIFDGKSPIRGGIPIAFPQFGPWGEKPLHGFARVCKWTLDTEVEKNPQGDLVAVLSLKDNEWTRKLWDFEFKLTFTVILSENTLQTTVNVTNPSKTKKFTFELLLHTYFQVGNVKTCTISGLKGSKYSCSRDDKNSIKDNEETVKIDGPITRLYQKTAAEHKISSKDRSLLIIKTSLPDTVIWNPGPETAKTIVDLPDDEYDKFVCVEAGIFSEPIQLKPGTSFEACQKLQAV